ncbi:cilia- and flagella-associated protein 90-like [Antedon mediterranea]|uniref:cilia- and flagella-associated protein 90-like n=1 Tax=Antedon mediterranea TaxID=105859 RepID=UPI003AF5EAB2
MNKKTMSTMSNYGRKIPTPEEVKLRWIEIVRREKNIRKNHLATKGDGSEQWPGIKPASEEELKEKRTYFNNNKQYQPSSTYDRLFHVEEGFHSKIHRDDRQHTMNLNVFSEESSKQIPVLSSSAYGHGISLEVPSRQHARVERVVKGFYRTRGTNLPEYGSDLS